MHTNAYTLYIACIHCMLREHYLSYTTIYHHISVKRTSLIQYRFSFNVYNINVVAYAASLNQVKSLASIMSFS